MKPGRRPAAAERSVSASPVAPRPFACEQSLPDQFEAVARQHPTRLAVSAAGQTLTYEALEQASNRAADVIRARLGPETRTVGLLLDPGAATVAAILGTLKAGHI